MKKLIFWLLAGLILLCNHTALAAITVGPGGLPNYDFSQIQAAIDSASNGNIIEVYPGTYNHIVCNAGISLTIHSVYGPEVTEIIGNGSFQSVWICNNSNITLDGFKITGSYNGIRCWASTPTFKNLLVTGNSNTTGSNASGWGIQLTNCQKFYMEKVNVINNSSSYIGGGISCSSCSKGEIKNSVISGNEAVYGGGIDIQNGGNIYLTHVTVSGNHASISGGGLRIANNVVPNLIIYIRNSILWDNRPYEIDYGYGSGGTGLTNINVNYSNIEGGLLAGVHNTSNTNYHLTWGAGNIDNDPLFADPRNSSFAPTEEGDYHLREFNLHGCNPPYWTPCVNMGSSLYTLPDDLDGFVRPYPAGLKPDMGAYEGNMMGYWDFTPPQPLSTSDNVVTDKAGSNDGQVPFIFTPSGVGFIPLSFVDGPTCMGKAFNFDGTRVIVVPHHPSLNFVDKGFTIAFWIKAPPTSNGKAIFDKRDSMQHGYHGIIYQNKPLIQIHGNGWTNYYPAGSSFTINDNDWHLVLFRVTRSYSVDPGKIKIFVSYGNSVASQEWLLPLGNFGDIDNNADLLIGDGQTIPPSNSKFVGALDEFRIWNRALTDSEIEDLFSYEN